METDDFAKPFLPEENEPSAAPRSGAGGADEEEIAALARRVQELEDLVRELIEIALVNRGATLVGFGKGLITRQELKKAYERIEAAHHQTWEAGGEYRILPGAAAYFLEED